MTSPLAPKTLTVMIRPVQMSDATHLQRMCWPDRPLDSIIDLVQRTQKLAASHRGLGAVAVQDGVPCGFGLLTRWLRAAEISDLIVHPQHRSQGIGSLLIGYLTNAARDLHMQTLEIGVALANPRALALYRRLGFADDRTIELNLGSGPEPVLYLLKHLN